MPTKEELLAKAQKPAEESRRLHRQYRGKIQTFPKCPIRSLDDFALWYTPGVAAPCRDIQKTPALVYDFTNKANSIAVVSDGTRVLGLGDIGPEAGLPVMEGKALLFKYLGGVDAVPICLGTKDPDEIVRTVKLLEPSFGGINLEDIAMPKCFRVLAEARRVCSIPVWHDDQQGTGAVLLAALLNALKIVGKDLGSVRIAMIGMGAANIPTYRYLKVELARTRGTSWPAISEEFSDGIGMTMNRIRTMVSNGRCAWNQTGMSVGEGSPRRSPVRTCAWHFPPAESFSRNGSKPWRKRRSCSPAPTRFLKSGRGKRKRPAPESSRPDEAIFPTR